MPRVLYITPTPPYPATSGANQRSAMLFEALRQSADVDLLLLQHPGRIAPDAAAELRRNYAMVGCVGMRIRAEFGMWRFVRPLAPVAVDRLATRFGSGEPEYAPQPRIRTELERCLRDRQYDAIVVRYLRAASRSGALDYHPTLVDVDDCDGILHLAAEGNPLLAARDRELRRRYAERMSPIVRRWACAADAVWVSNPNDVPSLPVRNVGWLANLPPPGAAPLTPHPKTETILSVGALHYSPHVESVDLFLKHCWPAIRAACPAARFEIVGVGLTPRLRNAWSRIAGVACTGFLEDLRTAYERSAFSIVPSWTGGGTHIKVLESLAYGRAVLTTPHGLRGYEKLLVHNESILVGNDFAALADACVRLIHSSELRARLAEAGGCVVAREFSRDRNTAIVCDTLRDCIRRGPLRHRARKIV